ncbi:unnamed protein product [Parascedosporium putredinis]|uniref:Uncharacterized protein n=1 Tax=Parascedosporium putredinis TaxID=1442378 RepID=A0A9P1GUN0_9PEZI|nr:unnamed protein product [Parascedosporium putredinis]CAI7987395.1 unnamed protein product [Parascedosporium putredinis]
MPQRDIAQLHDSSHLIDSSPRVPIGPLPTCIETTTPFSATSTYPPKPSNTLPRRLDLDPRRTPPRPRPSDAVIDLLQHLPYLSHPDFEPQVLPETTCVDYSALPSESLDALRRGRFDSIVDPPLDDDEALDPDCLCIALGRRHAWSLILDLANGTIIWYSMDGEWDPEDHDLGRVLPDDSPRRVAPDDGPRVARPTHLRSQVLFRRLLPRPPRLHALDSSRRRRDPLRRPREELGREDALRRRMLTEAGFPDDFDRDKWFEDEGHSQL